MSIQKQLFEIAQNMYVNLIKIIPGYLGKRFRVESAEKLIVIDKVQSKYGLVKYFCLGWMPLWRSKTLFTKEPETIGWIDNMSRDDTLWDIGANVGMYSIYAGKKGMQVFAFEPSALNTLMLSKNIEINNLKDNVFLFPVAVSDKNEFGYLNMTNTDLGGALSKFDKTDIDVVDEGGFRKNVIFKQGMFSFSIDELIEKYDFEIPNYIKIDVDSIEDKIIYGADKTLLSKNIKGLLIELDETGQRTKELIYFLERKGFKLKEKKHGEMFCNTTVYNYIFHRC